MRELQIMTSVLVAHFDNSYAEIQEIQRGNRQQGPSHAYITTNICQNITFIL